MRDQEIGSAVRKSMCGDWPPSAELQSELRRYSPIERSPDKHKILATVVENEVIPRLLLANRGELAMAPPATDLIAVRLAERVGEFSELVINHDAKVSSAYFEKLRDDGISLEGLFQDLLAPTARRLGELWEEDINDFVEVTRGIGHLQEIVRTYSQEFCEETSRPLSSKRALLMPVPGEQHTFGVSLLREHFIREGWRVWCGPCSSMNDIVKLVKGQWFDLVGLSASAVNNPTELADAIRAIRKVSTNKDLRVLVGGVAFNKKPDLVAAVGADATAVDARQAVLQVSN